MEQYKLYLNDDGTQYELTFKVDGEELRDITFLKLILLDETKRFSNEAIDLRKHNRDSGEFEKIETSQLQGLINPTGRTEVDNKVSRLFRGKFDDERD